MEPHFALETFMKVRIAFLLLLTMPRMAWSQVSRSYSLTDRSAASLATQGAGDVVNVGYARIITDTGSTTPLSFLCSTAAPVPTGNADTYSVGAPSFTPQNTVSMKLVAK